MKRVAICMSGGFRTFLETQESFRVHVVEHLQSLGYVIDLFVCITLDDSTKPWEKKSQITDDKQIIQKAFEPFAPKRLEVIDKNEASKIHKNIRQVYGIDRCFALTESSVYDYYLRVRPDYYYLYNIPDPAAWTGESIHTCYFQHARGCDLIFVLSRQMYETWWNSTIRPKIRTSLQDSISVHNLSWELEQWLFKDVPVYKDHAFEGGILREGNHLVVWSEQGHEKSLSPQLGLRSEYRTGTFDWLLYFVKLLKSWVYKIFRLWIILWKNIRG